MKAIKKTTKECKHISNVFALKLFFTDPKTSISITLGLFPIDIEEIFPKIAVLWKQIEKKTKISMMPKGAQFQTINYVYPKF